jgi:plasmid stabilization system protein ParE
MRARYTSAARRELEQAIDYLLNHAPHVAAAFAESVDQSVPELIPYSAQATDLPGVRRKHSQRFRYTLFYSIKPAIDELIILNIRYAAQRRLSDASQS